jgi:hypothetical protein
MTRMQMDASAVYVGGEIVVEHPLPASPYSPGPRGPREKD